MQIKRSKRSFTTIHSPFSTGGDFNFGFLGTNPHGCPYKSDKKLRLLDDDHLRLCYKNLYPKNEKDKYSLYSLPKSNSLKTPEISNGFQDTPFLIWDGQVADGQGLEQDRFVKIHEFRTT